MFQLGVYPTKVPMARKIEFLQVNPHKAKQAQIKLGQHIHSFNNKAHRFVSLVQEPQVYLGRAIGQPKSCNRYSIHTNPCTAIYTDRDMEGWFIESLSTCDITVFSDYDQ